MEKSYLIVVLWMQLQPQDKNYSGQPRMVVLGVKHFPRDLKSRKYFFLMLLKYGWFTMLC